MRRKALGEPRPLLVLLQRDGRVALSPDFAHAQAVQQSSVLLEAPSAGSVCETADVGATSVIDIVRSFGSDAARWRECAHIRVWLRTVHLGLDLA